MDDTDKRIAILLATYNSSRYLIQQIDSLLNQTFQKWTLYISDDGSIDNTLEIVNNYCTNYSNILFLKDEIKSRGAKNRFIWLLERIDADYYMFCDQDDIWLPKKIELTYSKMLQTEIQNIEKPIVIFTDLKVVDNKLNVISPSFWNYSKIKPSILKTFNYLCICNVITGCTMMINKNSYNISLPIPPEATMHDYWIALKITASGGIIDYIKEPTVLYRQHDTNVIGAKLVDKGYVRNKLISIRIVIKQNKLNLKMIRAIKKTSLAVYLLHKILYFIKR